MTPYLKSAENSRHFGKIVLVDFNSNEKYNIVSHENSYTNNAVKPYVQPNAQFSRSGKYIIYESDKNKINNINLFLVELR